MSCYNCDSNKDYQITKGLRLCSKCEKELSKQEKLKIQKETRKKWIEVKKKAEADAGSE